MKILKVLGIIFLLLILGFVVLGLVKPTVKYGHTITVDRPINEAWEIYNDDTQYSQWLKGFKSIDLISGTHGEVGSKYKVVVNPQPDQPDFEMIETVLAIEENDHVILQFDSDMMEFVQTTNFAEKGGKTVISTHSEVFGNGLMMKSLFAAMELFTGSFQAQEEENFNRLKTLMDNE